MDHGIPGQIADGNNLIGSFHAPLFHLINPWIHIPAAPVKISRMNMYHQWLAGYLFGRHPGRVGKPVM